MHKDYKIILIGKNLTGIRAMLNHESITPFVCFHRTLYTIKNMIDLIILMYLRKTATAITIVTLLCLYTIKKNNGAHEVCLIL